MVDSGRGRGASGILTIGQQPGSALGESAFAIGVDEAGYGPRLGPLCVGLVRVGGDPGTLGRALADPSEELPRVADSKQLFKGPRRLERLEAVALAALGAAGNGLPETLAELLEGQIPVAEEHPWYADLDLRLPLAAGRGQVAGLTASLERALGRAGGRLESAVCSVMVEGALNGALLAAPSKAAVEQEVIDGLWDRHLPGHRDGHLSCDRLGGRLRYGPWLAARFPFTPLEVLEETRARAAYRVHEGGRRLTFEFLVGGESRSPEVALASCVAKYHRELMMAAFNRYWCRERPELGTTAGYAEDAAAWLERLGGLREARRRWPALVRLR